jgi:CDP-diacylglycerol--serine O-phosphatidyltransferase
MIGVYDYTVILTYLSLVSAMCGCIVSTSGNGHPYIGGFFLLICGLCDTFDGKVARSKKNRTEREKAFGVQIDSLSDLVAFGVLPACIAVGLLTSDGVRIIPFPEDRPVDLYAIIFLVIVIFYVLAALIRLAWFNVLDEEQQSAGDSGSKGYVGLPVTAAALIFPVTLLMHYFIPKDLSNLYVALLMATGLLFLGKFRVKKPGKRLLTILLIAGAVEFVLLLLMLLFPS